MNASGTLPSGRTNGYVCQHCGQYVVGSHICGGASIGGWSYPQKSDEVKALERIAAALERIAANSAAITVGVGAAAGFGFGANCGVCGSALVRVRGRRPDDDTREVCAQCLQSRLDQIADTASPEYGKAGAEARNADD